MRRKKRNAYKFADKKHSKKGKVSLALALLSFLSAVAMIIFSIQSGGKATVYIGSGVLGSVSSGLMLAGWVAVYVLGFYI